MQKEVAFENSEELRDFKEYKKDKLALAKVCVLSTAPNSHELDISEEVLRRDIETIKGQFLVAHMMYGDARSHDAEEVPVGYFIQDQEIEFEEVGEGNDKIVKAWVMAVLSKQYAKEAYEMFVKDNHRATSIEMKVEIGEDGHEVLSFDAYGSTILGKSIQPSCKDAEVSLVRFAEDATKFFAKKSNSLTKLKQFVKERNYNMAEEKSYKIDKSKEAMSTADWGDYDKAAMRDKIMEASNRNELVKAVYALVEDGWEDAPSEHLKYPIMMLVDDTFVYNRNALSSALAYAKQHDEQSVVDKVEKIYKDLDLDDSDGKEEKKMSEIEFGAVNIGDLWGLLWNAIREHDAWEYYIMGIYEEDNQKFAVLTDDDQKLYRLDFSLTEEGMTVADEVVEIKQEFIETENMKKFAEPENVADYRFAEEESHDDDDDEDEHDDDCDCDECKMKKLEARIAELEGCIEEKDNIIMGKDGELAELRAFKEAADAKEKASAVEKILSECKECLSEEQENQFREEGLACEMSAIDGWANGVKAVAFSQMKTKSKKSENGVFTFSAPAQNNNVPKNVWERLKNKY